MSKKLIFPLLLIAFLLVVGALSAPHQQKAEAQSGGISTGLHALHGYAWSSNTGWIRFDPQYGGVFASTTGATSAVLTGYAWSDPYDNIGLTKNIGWLSFNDYSGCPSSPCQPTINLTTGAVTGWARFYKPISDSNAGDWDGWVHLSGSTYNSSVNLSNNQFSAASYFWSGGNTNGAITGTSTPGWIHLCGSNYCVSVDTATTTCNLGKPNAPTNLVGSTGSVCGGVTQLSWTAPNPAPTGGYYVYRSDLSNPFITNGTSFTDSTQKTPGQTYSYQVSAFNYCGGQYFESAKVSANAVASAACTPQATLEFYARPDTVPKGGQCNLIYNVHFQANCVITQPTLTDFKHFAQIVSPAGGISGATTTSGIQKSLRYVMTCTSGSTAISQSATCYVAGDYQHI
jgi:hypothetical protein